MSQSAGLRLGSHAVMRATSLLLVRRSCARFSVDTHSRNMEMWVIHHLCADWTLVTAASVIELPRLRFAAELLFISSSHVESRLSE